MIRDFAILVDYLNRQSSKNKSVKKSKDIANLV